MALYPFENLVKRPFINFTIHHASFFLYNMSLYLVYTGCPSQIRRLQELKKMYEII